MDEMKPVNEKNIGTVNFERLQSEYAKIEGGTTDVSLYLDALDRFLMQLQYSDMLESAVSSALNSEYLDMMYPDGEDGTRRDPKSITIDDIRNAGLDLPTIKAFLGEKAIRVSAMITDFSQELR